MGRKMNKNFFHLIINSLMLFQHLDVYTVWSVAEGSEVHAATTCRVKISSALTLKMGASWTSEASATLSIWCKHPRTGLTSTVDCHESLKSINKQSSYSKKH
jgi:hypothetical protein